MMTAPTKHPRAMGTSAGIHFGSSQMSKARRPAATTAKGMRTANVRRIVLNLSASTSFDANIKAPLCFPTPMLPAEGR